MAFNLKKSLISQYSKFTPAQKIVMVSGTLGKTSTILAAEEVLAETGNILSITQSILSKPEELLKITPQVNKVLIETKLNYPSDAQETLKLIKGEVLVISQVLEGQNDLLQDQLFDGFTKLVDSLPQNGAVILNWDDPLSRKLAQNSRSEVIFYGTSQKNCHIWAGNIQFSQNRVTFELNYGVERVEVITNFVSKAEIYSLLAATALGLRADLRLTQIKSNLEKIKPQNHLMEVIPGFSGSTIIDDSFDGLILNCETAIDSLNFLTARRRVVVLGSMYNGQNPEKLYQKIAQKIYQDKIDLVLLAKGLATQVGDELLKLGFIAGRLEQDLTNPQIVGQLLKVISKGDIVLVKGAKEVRLDEVVSKITRK